jgi:hypothetical protein
MLEAPKLDDRSAQQVFEQLEEDLRSRLGVNARAGDPMAEALLRVFARYCELVIQRLNRVPEKNYLAFLEALNISRIPPIPAQAPLTFIPVKKLPATRAPLVVPAHTKVAAAAGLSDGEPVVFETTRELALTDVALEVIAALDPQEDLYSDKSALATPEGGPGEFAFLAQTPVAHEFYIRVEQIFGSPGISWLGIQLEIGDSAPAARRPLAVEWRIPTSMGDFILKPLQDSTSGLSQTGEVIFADLPEWPDYDLFGRHGHWLACRLRQPIARPEAMAEAAALRGFPAIQSISLAARWESDQSPVNAAFSTAAPIDLSRDFYPFGERPRFNDVFYVASDAFAKPGSNIALNVTLTNPASGPRNHSLPRVTKAGRPVVKWECWNGKHWAEIDCRDHTEALTENGQVLFPLPESVKAVSVNGQDGFWIRARLVAGNYGEDERLEFSDAGTYRRIPSTLAPPSIQSITVTSWLSVGPLHPDAIVTHNNFALDDVEGSVSLRPFRPALEPNKALYLGFRVPGENSNALAGRAVELYFHMRAPTKGRAYLYDASRQSLPQLTWQYWNGKEWKEASVNDSTESLGVSGVVTFQAGEDAVAWRQTSLGRDLYWIRVLWSAGGFGCEPELTRLLLNTVTATQTVTLQNELLGSSNGKPDQKFRSARTPVLRDLHLEVQEPDMPGAEELARIRATEGAAAVTTVLDAQGRVEQIWVRWHEVADWLSSTHGDRHFVVDRETGEIMFGDGRKGRIPPAGTNNIRLRRYQTGGGAGGNVPDGTIEQLRTTVPYVDRVTNLEAAAGGQNLEDWESLCERGSRWLRHRDRAVTAEDYEDLAKLASPLVAKARCYPAEDRARDPLGNTVQRGMVSVVVVPHSADPRPRPDLTLLRRVRDFLIERSVAETSLVVLAPEYVRISVETSVVAESAHMGASVKARCEEKLMRFLHPVLGGEQNRGWEFGALPHESDLYAQLEAVAGLSYIRSLRIGVEEDRPDLLKSGNFLISPGEHRIRLGV